MEIARVRGRTLRVERPSVPAERVTEAMDRANQTRLRDLRGKTLRENLDARQQSGVVYLKWLIFVNGADDLFCQQSRFPLATNPGDRVVRLCGAFKTTHKTDPGYAAALIIHEELHSLGLGENPPSSAEISRRVVARCGR